MKKYNNDGDSLRIRESNEIVIDMSDIENKDEFWIYREKVEMSIDGSRLIFRVKNDKKE